MDLRRLSQQPTTQLSYRLSGASNSDGLSVHWRVDPQLIGDLPRAVPELNDKEVTDLAAAFKFAEMLPADACRELVFRRLFDELAVHVGGRHD